MNAFFFLFQATDAGRLGIQASIYSCAGLQPAIDRTSSNSILSPDVHSSFLLTRCMSARCTPAKNTAVRCTSVRDTPLKCTRARCKDSQSSNYLITETACGYNVPVKVARPKRLDI